MGRNDSRERILQAAMDAIAERGLTHLRMEDVGKRVGMSPGHILYYYRSKQALLLETLRWSDDLLHERSSMELPYLQTAQERLRWFIDIYLPTGPGQPEWLLWLQVWALGGEDPEVAAVTDGLNARWEAMLAGLIRFGVGRGEFQASARRALPGSTWRCSTASACTCSTTPRRSTASGPSRSRGASPPTSSASAPSRRSPEQRTLLTPPPGRRRVRTAF